MKSEQRLVQPPLVAVRLLTLFAPADREESIVGDLVEEFSRRVNQSGAAVARRWFWRQTLATTGHLLGSEFRSAPWLMLLTVMAGFWLIGFTTRLSSHTMQRFLDAQGIFESHPGAYLFWLKFPLEMGRVILCLAIGCVVAFASRRKELSAVIALAGAQMALFGTATIAVIFSGREWFHWFLFMTTWNGLCAIATVVGGAMVKMRRTTELRRSAA